MRNEDLYKLKDIDQAAIQYMNSIKPFTSLKKDEELKLIVDYKKKKDLNARNKVINSNLKYTCKIASEYRNRGIPFSRLISEANDALFYALEKFDVKYNVKLMVYAKWWIKERVNAFVNDKDFDFSDLPTEKQEQIDSESDYSTNYGLDCEYQNNAFHEQDLLNKENDNKELLDVFYKVLNEREIDILNMYYGREPYDNSHTLEEIGAKYKFTRERARQIIERAITKMRTEAMILKFKEA